jgi:S1-C subfamily serine protease
MPIDNQEKPHSHELLALCYAILGLSEGASRDHVSEAFEKLRTAHEGKVTSGKTSVPGDLKQAIWARDTLLIHLNDREIVPTSDLVTSAPGAASGQTVRPAVPVSLAAEKKSGIPWWLSSVVVIVLAVFACVFYYSYQLRHPNQGKRNPIVGLTNTGTAVQSPSEQVKPKEPSGAIEETGDLAQLLQQVKKSVVTLQFGQVIGSGFLISPEGHIVTNAHVVNDRKGTAQFPGGDQVEVNVLKVEPDRDFALVKIGEGGGYPFLKLGDSSSCREGDTVIAVGSPFNYQSSFTKGIVSAKDRRFSHLAVSLIQTDAAINEGNSGGPLINTAGEVIGINTLKIKMIAEGLNFAIAINEVKGVIDEGLKISENDRLRDSQNIEARIFQQRRKEADLEQESKERIAKAQQESDRRYKDQIDEVKKRLDEAKKRQTLQTCFSEVNKKIDDMWNDECRAGSKPARCALLPFAANRLKTAQLQAQSECVRLYGE